MTTITRSARATLRALTTVTLYIIGAAAVGTSLALISEAHAATLAMGAL